MATATYVLMHRDVPTIRFEFDPPTYEVVKLLEVLNVEHAPITVFNRLGRITKRTLNAWWRSRGMLASNNMLYTLAARPEIRNKMNLAERSYCLSLSDCYWVCDEAQPQLWSEINLFDNAVFDELNLVVAVHSSPQGSTLLAHTVINDVECEVEQIKKWVIFNGERMFLKAGGFPFNQASYNEIVATRLYRRLLKKNEYVSYTLHEEEDGAFCASKLLLGEDEELVPMYDLLRWFRKPDTVSWPRFLLNRLRGVGAHTYFSTGRREFKTVVRRLDELAIDDAEGALSKMFVCDYILANEDRHYNNFGVIRDSKTLRFKRVAPIYDTGLCLWCRAKKLEEPRDLLHRAMPFRPKGMKPDAQLAIFDRLEWFDAARAEGFADEAKAILDRDPHMPKGRTELIHFGIERNIERVSARIERRAGRQA